jgi:hypothetical protein
MTINKIILLFLLFWKYCSYLFLMIRNLNVLKMKKLYFSHWHFKHALFWLGKNFIPMWISKFNNSLKQKKMYMSFSLVDVETWIPKLNSRLYNWTSVEVYNYNKRCCSLIEGSNFLLPIFLSPPQLHASWIAF